MEFKDVFTSLAITLVVVLGMLSLSSDINGSWGTTIGNDVRNDLESQNSGILGNLSQASLNANDAATPEEGQASGDAQQNILRRGYNIITQLPSFVNLPVKMIGVFLDYIPGLPEVIKFLAQYTFAFAYYLTLAYLLITGARRLF